MCHVAAIVCARFLVTAAHHRASTDRGSRRSPRPLSAGGGRGTQMAWKIWLAIVARARTVLRDTIS